MSFSDFVHWVVTTGAPAGIWPVVRTYDGEKCGGGGVNMI